MKEGMENTEGNEWGGKAGTEMKEGRNGGAELDAYPGP